MPYAHPSIFVQIYIIDVGMAARQFRNKPSINETTINSDERKDTISRYAYDVGISEAWNGFDI